MYMKMTDGLYAVGRFVVLIVSLINNLYIVSLINFATLDNACENTLTGHNALTHELFYSTAIVALLAYLCNLDNALADLKRSTHGDSIKLYTLSGDVFCEYSVAESVGGESF